MKKAAVTALKFLLAIAVCSAIFTVGFFATNWLNVKNDLLSHILSGIAGIAVIGSTAWIAGQTRGFRDSKNHSSILFAIEELNKGNFSVTLETNGHRNEISDKFNEMAKNLGDLETMRQDFISNVSHEIQSPLTSIGGFAALLQNDALPAGERRHYAEIIESESRRLSSLSGNLLKLSALDGGEKPLTITTFRLDRQLQQTALTLEPQWSAKSLNVEADLEKCEYSGDEDLLSQVWVNLLHNAVKFTPDGGTVSVQLKTDGGQLKITVADSGVGISAEDAVHIFERFYKADKSRDRALGGSGLGLSLVKKIAELHGASVGVDSDPGKGTAFTVILPREK